MPKPMPKPRTDTTAARTVQVSRRIPAAAAELFRAWTEPDQLRRWSCPEGAEVSEATVDLRVGGRYRIRMTGSAGGVFTVSGAYREIDPPRRLVYTWDWEEEALRVG